MPSWDTRQKIPPCLRVHCSIAVVTASRAERVHHDQETSVLDRVRAALDRRRGPCVPLLSAGLSHRLDRHRDGPRGGAGRGRADRERAADRPRGRPRGGVVRARCRGADVRGAGGRRQGRVRPADDRSAPLAVHLAGPALPGEREARGDVPLHARRTARRVRRAASGGRAGRGARARRGARGRRVIGAVGVGRGSVRVRAGGAVRGAATRRARGPHVRVRAARRAARRGPLPAAPHGVRRSAHRGHPVHPDSRGLRAAVRGDAVGQRRDRRRVGRRDAGALPRRRRRRRPVLPAAPALGALAARGAVGSRRRAVPARRRHQRVAARLDGLRHGALDRELHRADGRARPGRVARDGAAAGAVVHGRRKPRAPGVSVAPAAVARVVARRRGVARGPRPHGVGLPARRRLLRVRGGALLPVVARARLVDAV